MERSIWSFTFTSLFVILFGAVTSLRGVKLIVEPGLVIRGRTAALICLRDMQGAPLYSVKWYRGNHEFFRYTPMENPEIRLFGLPGIYVDMSQSNGSQVMLRRLELEVAGNFSCEVTADSPSFATQIATKFIDIIALPQLDPILQADKDRYLPGDTLTANCSSGPAKPATNLTIFLNDKPLRSSDTRWSNQRMSDGLFTSLVNVKLKLTSGHFPGGRLRVECQASIYDAYKRMAKLDFFTPDTDPRPERITLNGGASSCFQSFFLLFLLFFLPMVVCQDYGQIYEGLLSDTNQYYDEESNQNLLLSAIGG
ncbi:uncharacterized protein [Battus philenor]|uniref:uncharacterized protein n=1 Tax=Battus philenor TaxID=42288 RepID=UPI0035D0FDAD